MNVFHVASTHSFGCDTEGKPDSFDRNLLDGMFATCPDCGTIHLTGTWRILTLGPEDPDVDYSGMDRTAYILALLARSCASDGKHVEASNYYLDSAWILDEVADSRAFLMRYLSAKELLSSDELGNNELLSAVVRLRMSCHFDEALETAGRIVVDPDAPERFVRVLESETRFAGQHDYHADHGFRTPEKKLVPVLCSQILNISPEDMDRIGAGGTTLDFPPGSYKWFERVDVKLRCPGYEDVRITVDSFEPIEPTPDGLKRIHFHTVDHFWNYW